jgi:hypothetical protein
MRIPMKKVIFSSALLCIASLGATAIHAQSTLGDYHPQCDRWTRWTDSAGVEHVILQPDGSDRAYHMTMPPYSGQAVMTDAEAERLIRTARARGRNVKRNNTTDPICF